MNYNQVNQDGLQNKPSAIPVDQLNHSGPAPNQKKPCKTSYSTTPAFSAVKVVTVFWIENGAI